MKQYQQIIFDLDGTLTDSKPGILNAAYYAFDKMRYEKPDFEKLNELIGIPLQDYFRQLSGMTENEIDDAVKHFRIYYGEKGVYENKVFPGIISLLMDLKNAGKDVYISTAKYEKYARVMIEDLTIKDLITDMVGADAGGIHASKSELTAKIIQRNNITDLSRTIVIGDKYMDIQAGHDNMIDSIAVTYGFGSVIELESVKPTYLVSTVEELKKIVLP